MTASRPYRQHTEQPRKTAKRPEAPLVRDEEALAAMAKQQAINRAVWSKPAQVRGVWLVRSPSHCKTVGSAYDGSNPSPATKKAQLRACAPASGSGLVDRLASLAVDG
jgi:hypothetical protein